MFPTKIVRLTFAFSRQIIANNNKTAVSAAKATTTTATNSKRTFEPMFRTALYVLNPYKKLSSKLATTLQQFLQKTIIPVSLCFVRHLYVLNPSSAVTLRIWSSPEGSTTYLPSANMNIHEYITQQRADFRLGTQNFAENKS